jgi:16S rRNA (adenine1518-N6/adenine1519-N6)-dimethyltransferase
MTEPSAFTGPSPADLLRRHRLRPKKDWGQNFLGDLHTLQRIARLCGVGPGDTVVELGAGLGHLTRQLAATGAQVVAVERDRDLVRVLQEELREQEKIRVLAANAATIDFAEAAGVPRPVVAGNLPYHLTSSILFQVIRQRTHLSRAVFLLQKEVARRIASPPGGREYGLLSVLLQAWAGVEVCFEVPAGLFLPPPKVDSAVVRLDMLPTPRAVVSDEKRFVRLVKAAFAHRRKTLLNALKADKDLAAPEDLLSAMKAAGVAPEQRAETLSPEDFASLERALPALGP